MISPRYCSRTRTITSTTTKGKALKIDHMMELAKGFGQDASVGSHICIFKHICMHVDVCVCVCVYLWAKNQMLCKMLVLDKALKTGAGKTFI